MNCPRCKGKMSVEGLTQVINDETYQQWVCPSCGYMHNQKLGENLPN